MPFLNISTNVLMVIVGIGMLIFVHELGHFLVAKRVGVRVFAFSLGFGPAILKKKVGETEYRLSLLPLGGYVKLAGESPNEDNTGADWEFMSKSPRQRAAVLSAGVLLNAVLAFLAFIAAFRIGVPFISAKIGEVQPGWPAWEAGLEEGDKIIQVNNNTDPDFEDIFTELALSDSKTGAHLVIERGDRVLDLTVYPKYDDQLGIQRIGVRPAMSLEVEKIFAYKDSVSPALKGGLQAGDRIMAVNDKLLSDGMEFVSIVAAAPGKELDVKVLRNGEEKPLKIIPEPSARWMIGLTAASTIIEGIKREAVASRIGLVNGDRIVSIDGQKVTGFSQIQEILSKAIPGPHLIEVMRNNEINPIELPIKDNETINDFLNGIYPFFGLAIDTIIKDYPAERAGIMPGDRIISINDKELGSWNDLVQAVVSSNGNPMKITWSRNDNIMSSEITPVKDEKNAIGQIGIKLKEETIMKQYSLFVSCWMGINKAIVNIKRIYLTINGFITGRVSEKALGGPILIAQATYESAKHGIGNLLYFMGIISINLAFLNILPIPVLDGGHLLFILVEKIKGSPVSARTLSIANYIGLGLVISLVLFATRNDVMRILNIL